MGRTDTGPSTVVGLQDLGQINGSVEGRGKKNGGGQGKTIQQRQHARRSKLGGFGRGAKEKTYIPVLIVRKASYTPTIPYSSLTIYPVILPVNGFKGKIKYKK